MEIEKVDKMPGEPPRRFTAESSITMDKMEVGEMLKLTFDGKTRYIVDKHIATVREFVKRENMRGEREYEYKTRGGAVFVHRIK